MALNGGVKKKRKGDWDGLGFAETRVGLMSVRLFLFSCLSCKKQEARQLWTKMGNVKLIFFSTHQLLVGCWLAWPGLL